MRMHKGRTIDNCISVDKNRKNKHSSCRFAVTGNIFLFLCMEYFFIYLGQPLINKTAKYKTIEQGLTSFFPVSYSPTSLFFRHSPNHIYSIQPFSVTIEI